MMDAKEARHMTFNNEVKALRNELERVYGLIREAAEEGRYMVYLTELSGNVLAELSRKGYYVEQTSMKQYAVSWSLT